jgi:hypothetical protein
MKSKKSIPKHIEAKFNKPQFQIGDAVLFSWLGLKRYGHVKQIKQSTWGTSYLVETADNVRYPCGIEIGGYYTQYTSGCIYSTETNQIPPEIRADRASKDIVVRTILSNPGREATSSSDHLTISPGNDNKPVKRTRKKSGVESSTTHDDKLNNYAAATKHTPKRDDTESTNASVVTISKFFK